MSIASSLTIAQPNPDGSLPVPAAPDAAANAAAEALQREAQLEALQAQVAQLQEILAKPLTEILAEQQAIADAFFDLKLIPKKLNLLHAAPVGL